jgi:hypothetical protein
VVFAYSLHNKYAILDVLPKSLPFNVNQKGISAVSKGKIDMVWQPVAVRKRRNDGLPNYTTANLALLFV